MPVLINGQSLDTFGVVPIGLTGWLSPSYQARDSVGVPSRLAAVAAAGQGVPRLAEATVTVMLRADRAASFDLREATMLALTRALAGRVAVSTVDRPGRRRWSLCAGVSAWAPINSGQPLGTVPLAAVIRLWDVHGGSEDAEASAWALSTTPTPIPLGTLPSAGWLYAWGVTDPLVIRSRDARGAVTAELTVPVAGASGFALDLTHEEGWLIASDGSRATATAMSGRVPALDPDDAAAHALVTGGAEGTAGHAAVGATQALAAWPTVALSSGAGLLITRRRWRL